MKSKRLTFIAQSKEQRESLFEKLAEALVPFTLTTASAAKKIDLGDRELQRPLFFEEIYDFSTQTEGGSNVTALANINNNVSMADMGVQRDEVTVAPKLARRVGLEEEEQKTLERTVLSATGRDAAGRTLRQVNITASR